MRRFLLITSLTATMAVPAAGAAPAARTSSPVTYPGNSTPPPAGVPDITSILVSDTPQGLVTFQINFAPGTETPSQDSYGVYIDSDENPTTGDPGGPGTDYLLLYDGTQNAVGLYKWDGKSSYVLVSTSSAQENFEGDSDYLVVAASDMGITDGFNFYAAAAVGPDPNATSQVDIVPSNGTNLHYAMQSKATITLKLTDWEDTATAHAGKAFTTAIIATRSDSNEVVTSGATVSCTLKVRGRTVAVGTHAFSTMHWYKGAPKKAAVCDWVLPAKSVGETLTAKETVTLGDSSVSKTFTARIRR